MFHHVPFQALIIVWVFLMSGELEIIQSQSVNMECQSVMACHSVQTDKLLCCQSGYQIKQIVRVIDDKQENEKNNSPFHHYGMNTSNGRCIFCNQLLYNYPHLHAMLLNQPNQGDKEGSNCRLKTRMLYVIAWIKTQLKLHLNLLQLADEPNPPP